MRREQVVKPRLERLAARDLKRLSIEVDCSDSPSRANSAGKLYRDIPTPASDVKAPHPGADFNAIEKRYSWTPCPLSIPVATMHWLMH
jgi:hypothetical protein